jgi:hypothetical protein
VVPRRSLRIASVGIHDEQFGRGIPVLGHRNAPRTTMLEGS